MYLFIYLCYFLFVYIYIILNLVSGRISFPASRFWETSHRMVIPFWMVNGLDGSTGMPELVRQNERKIPSGYVKITMENNHRNSEFYHEEWVDLSIVM